MDNNCSPKRLSGLNVAIEAFGTSSYSPYSRLLELSTPSLRKSACRATPAERLFAYDTACQCVEEALQSRGPSLLHARYFKSDRFRVLREVLQIDAIDDCFQPSLSNASLASTEDDSLEAPFSDLQLKDTASSEMHIRKLGIWKKIKRRLSTESLGRHCTAESPKLAADKTSPGGSAQEEKDVTFLSINVERSLALLVSAAPSRGEVQHWVWLLRCYLDKCSMDNTSIMLGYLAKVTKVIAPEEEWLRLLTRELTPVLAVMRDNDLPGGSQAMLRVVADRAMQVAEEAILLFRAARSSRLENAGLLVAAVRLQVLVAKCASGAACADMSALFHQLLTAAAHHRFRELLAKCSSDAGMSLPTVGAPKSKDASSRMVACLAGVCDQLVQDLFDDQECYQAAFPVDCGISLPSISCKVFCNLMRVELAQLLEQSLEPNRAFFALFKAVYQLEKAALQWAPNTLGTEGSLCTSEGRLPFLSHIENWMRSVRSKLMQWSMRLLKEEVWQHAAADSATGLRCSSSLVELFRALCSVAEDHADVYSTHPAYAALMERTLSKVVLVHVAGLERLCQEEMPSKAGKRTSTSQLRSIGSRAVGPSSGPFQPSTTLCMLLSDLREIRSKQADLSNAVRLNLPPEWWGKSVDDGAHQKLRIGDRFKLCQVAFASESLLNCNRLALAAKCRLLQVEIERRYAAVLHHAVKRMMEVANQLLIQLLLQPCQDIQQEALPLISNLDEQLERLAQLLDARVLRRVARELWNTLGGVLHDDLLSSQDNQDGNLHHSIGNVAPRIQYVDAVLKHISDHIVSHQLIGLVREDEPEKVTKLRRMLALFLSEDEGKSIESL